MWWERLRHFSSVRQHWSPLLLVAWISQLLLLCAIWGEKFLFEQLQNVVLGILKGKAIGWQVGMRVRQMAEHKPLSSLAHLQCHCQESFGLASFLFFSFSFLMWLRCFYGCLWGFVQCKSHWFGISWDFLWVCLDGTRRLGFVWVFSVFNGASRPDSRF